MERVQTASSTANCLYRTYDEMAKQYNEAIESFTAYALELKYSTDGIEETVEEMYGLRKCKVCGIVCLSSIPHACSALQGRPFKVDRCFCGAEMGKTALRLHMETHIIEAAIARKQARLASLLSQIEALEEKRLRRQPAKT